MMANQRFPTMEQNRQTQLTLPEADRGVLANLLRDTGMAVLAMLSEKYGLRRVPGLAKKQIVARILKHLTAEDQTRLEQELIAARFGQASIDDLLAIVLEQDADGLGSRPRLEEMSVGDASLVENSTRRWVYTMRGHDVVIDLNQRSLACDCPFFAFAAKRHMPCKHLVTALRLVPPVYAREVLIDLAVARRFGAHGRFDFESDRAA
jgi:predicted nucleic acid-binding Zn finger protein